MTEIIFNYKGNLFNIQGKEDEKMKDILNRFCIKSQNNFNSLLFLYGGQKINEELNFNEIANKLDMKSNKMNILVYDNENNIENLNEGLIKSKAIICPKCQEICLMKIDDYKIILYNCKNSHKIENILLNELEQSQKINEIIIKCNDCNNNKYKSYNKQFYICLSCKHNLCPLCKSTHNSSHFIIDYDKKNYICNIHNDNYISYCENFHSNLCMLCDNEHNKSHNLIYYSNIIEDKNKLLEEMNKFKIKIDKLNNKINEIIEILNNIKENINLYYEINNTLLKNYEIQNKNYEILKNLKEIRNNIMINDIEELINENDIIKNFEILFDMNNKFQYKKNSVDRIKLIYKINNFDKKIKIFDKVFVKNNNRFF